MEEEDKSYDDGTMVLVVPRCVRCRLCLICGALEVYTVMGPAVGPFGTMPSSCANPEHLLLVRAYARGEAVTIKMPRPMME